MTDHVLERRFWVPRPRVDVFEFFADPRNLPAVNPPAAPFRWLAAPPGRLAAGTVLDFSVRLLRVAPTRWRVMVREFDPPYRFVDVQIRGPFARWEHHHRFVDGAGPGGDAETAGTWVEDRITYQMPFGPIGDMAHGLGAGRSLDALFDYRERRARELLAVPGSRGDGRAR